MDWSGEDLTRSTSRGNPKSKAMRMIVGRPTGNPLERAESSAATLRIAATSASVSLSAVDLAFICHLGSVKRGHRASIAIVEHKPHVVAIGSALDVVARNNDLRIRVHEQGEAREGPNGLWCRRRCHVNQYNALYGHVKQIGNRKAKAHLLGPNRTEQGGGLRRMA